MLKDHFESRDILQTEHQDSEREVHIHKLHCS